SILIATRTHREENRFMDGIKYAVFIDKSIRLLGKNQYTSNVESGSTRTELKEILFSRLFTTATNNQIITIFIPFSTSSSQCRITPRGCGFFFYQLGLSLH
ncbi:hypothetical protein Pfo_022425, partial [Paulownia fortunei]